MAVSDTGDKQFSYGLVVPCHVKSPYLFEALQSVARQSVKPSAVVFVLNNPEDVSVYFRTIQEFIRSSGCPSKIIVTNDLPLGAARNRGIESLNQNLISILDDDDIWEDDKGEVQLEALAANPNLVGVSGNFEIFTTKNPNIGFGGFDDVKGINGSFKNHLMWSNYFSGGSAAMFRRDAWEKAGRFNEFMRGAEDWEFWQRLCEVGDLKIVDQFLVRVRKGEDSMTAHPIKPVFWDIFTYTKGMANREDAGRLNQVLQAVKNITLTEEQQSVQPEGQQSVQPENQQHNAPEPALAKISDQRLVRLRSLVSRTFFLKYLLLILVNVLLGCLRLFNSGQAKSLNPSRLARLKQTLYQYPMLYRYSKTIFWVLLSAVEKIFSAIFVEALILALVGMLLAQRFMI